MANPQLVLVNQFGEESINSVQSAGTDVAAALPIADSTILGNISGVLAAAAALTTLQVSNKLPAKTGVTAISPAADPSAQTIGLSTSNTYTDAAVNTAVNTALSSLNGQLTTINQKLSAILAALKVVS